jgi:hypothetical protein
VGFFKKAGKFLKKNAVRIATAPVGGEAIRALTGKSSIFDPALKAVGLGIDKAGPAPDANKIGAGAKGVEADNLARAYAMQDEAKKFATQRSVRDPQGIEAEQIRQTTVGQAGDESGAADMLKAAAMGQVPSKAEAQMRMGADALAKKQMSMAASARGSERRGSKRAAMLAIGDQGAELNQQAAALRADEMAQGRGAFATHAQNAQKLQQDALSQQAAIDAAAATADVGNKLTAATTTSQLQQAADKAMIDKEQQDQQIRQSGMSTGMNAATTIGTAQADRAQKEIEAANADHAAAKAKEAGQKNARLQTALKIGGAIFSDERKKADIEPIPDKAAVRLADAYGKMASTYHYKNDDKTTAGVVAQDLERDPLGKTFVHRDDDGMRSVDYNGLNAAVLAGLAAKLDAQTQRTRKSRRAT